MKVPGQEPVELPLYNGNENVSGVVDISIPAGKKVDHQGVRIEMIGQTGMRYHILKHLSLIRYSRAVL